MKRILVFLTMLWMACVIPLSAFATDGDKCTASIQPWINTQCFILCDGKAGDGACSEFIISGEYKRVGFHAITATGCSAGTLTVNHGPITGGALAVELTTVDLASFAVQLDGYPNATQPMKYINADVSGSTGCSNVSMYLYLKQ